MVRRLRDMVPCGPREVQERLSQVQTLPQDVEVLQVRSRVASPQRQQTCRGLSEVQIQILEQTVFDRKGTQMMISDVLKDMCWKRREVASILKDVEDMAEIVGDEGFAIRWRQLCTTIADALTEMEGMAEGAYSEDERRRREEFARNFVGAALGANMPEIPTPLFTVTGAGTDDGRGRYVTVTTLNGRTVSLSLPDPARLETIEPPTDDEEE